MAMTTTLPAKTVGRSVIPLADRIRDLKPDMVLDVSKITSTGSGVVPIKRPTTARSTKYGGLELPIVSVDLDHFVMAMDQLPGGRAAYAAEIEAAQANFTNPQRSPKTPKSPAILQMPNCTTCPKSFPQSVSIRGPVMIPQPQAGFVSPTIPSLLPIPKVTAPQIMTPLSQVTVPQMVVPQVTTPQITRPMAVPVSIIKPLPVIQPVTRPITMPNQALAPTPLITPVSIAQPVRSTIQPVTRPVIQPLMQPMLRPGVQPGISPMILPVTQPRPTSVQPQHSIAPLTPTKPSSASLMDSLLFIGSKGKITGRQLEFDSDEDEDEDEDEEIDEDEEEY